MGLRAVASIRVKGATSSWEETFEVESKEKAESQVNKVLDDFNKTEKARYGSGAKLRELVAITGFKNVNLTKKCEACGHQISRQALEKDPNRTYCVACEARLKDDYEE